MKANNVLFGAILLAPLLAACVMPAVMSAQENPMAWNATGDWSAVVIMNGDRLGSSNNSATITGFHSEAACMMAGGDVQRNWASISAASESVLNCLNLKTGESRRGETCVMDGKHLTCTPYEQVKQK